ncbi:MAG: sulfatase [Planctomycetes bacterium]|nr:sulfatase [Planctomycetota bacterium]
MKMNSVIASFFLLASVCATLSIQGEAMAKEPLNVLILNVDDLKPILGCYGDDTIRTPNIDKLAARGTVFHANYCQQSVCAPSRVSFYTGLRPDSTGVRDLHTHMRDVNPDITTLPQYFKSQGYDSTGYGKILHGAKNDDPRSWTLRGDLKGVSVEGMPEPVMDKFQSPKIHKAFAELMAQKPKAKNSYIMKQLKGKELYPATESLEVPDEAYPDGKIAQKGIEHLKAMAGKNKPFCLVLGFKKPHLPFCAPQKYWDLYKADDIQLAPHQTRSDDRPQYAYHSYGELGAYTGYELGKPVPPEKQRELIHGYMACVSYVDAQIGKVMKTMEESGLLKNTAIVLWGDHGWHLGDHGLWCKHSNYEQATRSPLIIAAPGYSGSQHVRSETEFIDVFPTLCELTGVAPPNGLEGKSLLPLLQNPSSRVKEGAMSQYTRYNSTGYALRSGNYRLVYWVDKNFISFASFDRKLLKSVELYDYAKDPHEKHNLALSPEYSSVLSDMEAKMLSYFESVHDPDKAKAMLSCTKKYSKKFKK